MNKFADSSSMPSHLNVLGTSEEHTKAYCNTLKKCPSWQLRSAPKATSVYASGRWQGGGAEVGG